MSERAYSLEKKERMTAKKASSLAYNELLSLNELFVELQYKVEFDKNRIFYGKAKISTGFKKGMLQIDFVERGNFRVYSNIDAVIKRSNGKIVKKYIDKNKEVE